MTEQFDTLLERMRSPKARRGMAAAFRANSKHLGKLQLLLLANVPWPLNPDEAAELIRVANPGITLEESQ